jgi:dTMP kinase
VTTNGSSGHIVAIVGIDGAGKTTQARLLAGWLNAAGRPADYWQNAGGRRWFGRLAQLFGRSDAQALLGVGGMLFVESILRWLAIARALVRSRLRRRIAVMDRYSVCQYASIRAHVGPLRPVLRRRERRARRLYGLYPEPDLTLFLSVTPSTAWARVEARGTDHEDIDYLAAANAAYRSLPEAGRFVVIDANQDQAAVQRDLRAAVAARFAIDAPDAESTTPKIAMPRWSPSRGVFAKSTRESRLSG